METRLNSHTKPVLAPSPVSPQTTERTAGWLSQVLPRLLLSAPSHMADSHGGDCLDPKLQERAERESFNKSRMYCCLSKQWSFISWGGGTCVEAPEYLLDFLDDILGTYDTKHLTYPCRPAQRDAFCYGMKTLALPLMCCCAADQVVLLSLRSQRLLVLTPACCTVKHIS